MPKFCGLFGGGSKYETNEVPSTAIPHDPLEKSLCDVSEVESFLMLIDSYGQELSNTLSRLKETPAPLMAGFEKYCKKGSDGEQLLEQFSAQLNTCMSRVTSSMSHLERLSHFIKEFRPRFTKIGEAREKRQAAWAVQMQQDREVEKLKKQNIKLEKKTEQMNVALEAANQFQGCTGDLERVINGVLSQQLSIAAIATTAFNDCFAELFQTETPGVKSLDNNANEREDDDFVLGSLKSSSSAQQQLVSQRASSPPAASTLRTLNNNQNSMRENIPSIASAAAAPKYVVGEKVEVWSSSQNKWLEGKVAEVFEKGGHHEDYYVPAGVVKVESAAGTKFVQPDQMDSVLRKIRS